MSQSIAPTPSFTRPVYCGSLKECCWLASMKRSRADVGKNEARKDHDVESDEEVDEEHKPKTRKRDSEYGVSRGLDFRNVSFVLNVDFPPNPKSYAHRVGRTARGGARGVALSLVENKSEEQYQTLLAIQDEQPTISVRKASTDVLHARSGDDSQGGPPPTEQVQPVPLDFDLAQIEGFRYRVTDVSRAVTKNAVREARANELKMEILNSERLASHFENNPADLQLLRHDRLATHVTRVQDHLKHVPKYLLPRGMQAANLNKKRKKKKVKRTRKNDPLQSFEGDVTLDGVAGDDGDDIEEGEDPLMAEFMDDDDDDEPSAKKQKEEKKMYANTKDGMGRSTAGNVAWKKKHKKGEFSNKKRKSERKMKAPLGI